MIKMWKGKEKKNKTKNKNQGSKDGRAIPGWHCHPHWGHRNSVQSKRSHGFCSLEPKAEELLSLWYHHGLHHKLQATWQGEILAKKEKRNKSCTVSVVRVQANFKCSFFVVLIFFLFKIYFETKSSRVQVELKLASSLGRPWIPGLPASWVLELQVCAATPRPSVFLGC